MMEGYVSERSERKMVNGTAVEITTYQGEHCDEYMVREEENGRCSLFDRGILRLSWKEVDHRRTGVFTVYDKGKALRRQDWKGLDREEYRYMGNSKKGLELVIERNRVIYRGGFDSPESMKREGRGVEFDEMSGRVLRCGVWKHDELFQVIQEFESEEMMIEYDVEEGKENVSVLNRHPVYEGGYVFDEETSSYLRHGEGYEIDGGVATKERRWERGELVESVDLFDGWYVKMKGNDTFDWGKSMEIHNWNEWQNVHERVTELVIPSNCCNMRKWNVFDASGLTYLKRIQIGDDCFANVNKMILIGLYALESVVIGKNSFTKRKNDLPNYINLNRHFYLKDCERLKELKIGCYSFSDFKVCEIDNLPSLEVIEMGELNEDSWNFFFASLELKSDDVAMK